MKNEKLYLLIIFIFLLVLFAICHLEYKSYVYSFEDNYKILDISNNNNFSIYSGSTLRFNVRLSDNVKSSNKIYKWSSSNKEIATVDDNGLVKFKKSGDVSISAIYKEEEWNVKVKVYNIKKILVIIGDSRMDHFKDDNGFSSTDRYEVKYSDKISMINDYDRIYVVSLSGMRYNWLSGDGEYKRNNAREYVKDIIHEYENKTDDYVKYDIKLLFNLGINDLNHTYLDTTPSKVALKYLDKLEEYMNNDWSSEVINNISLNMVTLFPIQDTQASCYFPGRYDKDTIEFNNEIKSSSKYNVCDAYSDVGFNDKSFRKRNDKDCANRDGLHFSPEFNKKELYNYLINVCAND